MMNFFLIKLALKNTFRNKKRSLITATSLVIGVAMIIFANGFIDGLDNAVVEGQIRYDSGHVRIAPTGLIDDEEDLIFERHFKNAGKVKKTIEQETTGLTIHERLLFKAEISNGIYSLMARGLGVDIESYLPAFQLEPDIVLPQKKYNGYKPVWIGYAVAENFPITVGDTITILTRTVYGSYTADDFIIAGLIKSSNPVIDNFSLFINIDDARNFLDAEDMCSDFVGFLPFRSRAAVTKNKILSALADCEVETWQEKAEAILAINRFRRKVFGIVNFIIMAIAATSIANTVVMSFFERIKEIGTLSALGYQREAILSLLTIEAFFLGLVGASFGVFLGGAITYYFQVHGIDFSQATQTQGYAVSLSAIIYTLLSIRHIIFAFIIGIVITLISAILPALKFSKMNPVTALNR